MPIVCRIVHFSDLHLTAKDADYRYEPTLPHMRLRGMNEAFKTLLKETPVKKADHIIVTGDITDKGELEAWRKFKQYTEEANLSDKTSIVIGNHDICQLGRWSFKLRKKDWWKRAHDNKRRLMGRLTKIGRSYDYPWSLQINKHVTLFGIDSNNAGNWGDASNATGEIGADQLKAFARLLKINKDAPVKFVALHHSPNLPEKSMKVPPKNWLQKRYIRYTHEIPAGQRRALRLMCASHGVKRILHGHMHEYHARPLDGIPNIVGITSSTQPTATGDNFALSYWLYEIELVKNGTYRVHNRRKDVPFRANIEKQSFFEWAISYIFPNALK